MTDPSLADAEEISRQLLSGQQLLADAVLVGFPECTLRIRSNHPALLRVLAEYLAGFPQAQSTHVIDIVAIELPAWPEEAAFRDWPREPGKKGRKDSFLNLADGRLVHKVRTGMRFLQSDCHRVASGPCLENPNQVVNFINSQYMSQLQHAGWLLCHAAAVQDRRGVIAMAGVSGGGKSTLMLHLMKRAGLQYVTNDRLLIRREPGGVQTRGIAKWPRINPGTLLGNERLQVLAPAEKRRAWQALPADSLWELEEKYDVPVPAVFGAERVALQGRLRAVVMLSWQRSSGSPTHVRLCAEGDRSRLLGALMKDAGPFHNDPQGRFAERPAVPAEASYLDMLAEVPFHEVRGRVDFTVLEEILAKELLN